MQKINKKASILLWAVFLSVVISISFISISLKINKNITNYKENNQNEEINNYIKNKDFSNKDLWNNEELIFEDSKNYTKTLNFNKATEIRINSVNSTNFNININNWWPVFYSLLLYNNTSFAWNITSSWIITNNSSFVWNFDNTNNSWILYIKNLWWISNFSLTSSENILTDNKKYTITKIIWNKKLIKKEWFIKNFDLWDISWINYKNYLFEF